MRILITGVTGLLGVALQHSARTSDDLFGIYYPSRFLPFPLGASVRMANVSDASGMRAIFEWAKPDVVIHAAAIGSVDYAEQHREQTRAVNVGGTKVVSELCRDFKASLIYISSNAVFDGKTPLYSETDLVNPLNYYGQLKVDAENVVKASGVFHAIVRPILMYGWPYPNERGNLVTTWVNALRAAKPINVVENVYSKPLFAQSCAEAIWAVINQKRNGIFHVAGRDHVSLYEFAQTVAKTFDLDRNLVHPVPDSFFSELAPRPRDTSFDTTKMEHEMGILPLSLEDGLRWMKETE
jgi:dTDP-4-dehydrorhamnose reductase